MNRSAGGHECADEGCFNVQELHNHMQAHMGEREFVCSICKNTIENPGCVEDHMWMHLMFYECIICNGGLPDLESFKRHLEIHCDTEGIEIDMMAATQIAEQRLQETKAQLRFKCRINNSMIISIANANQMKIPQRRKASSTAQRNSANATSQQRANQTTTVYTICNKPINVKAVAAPNQLKPRPMAESKQPPTKPRTRSSSRKEYHKSLDNKAIGKNVAFNQFSRQDYFQYLDVPAPMDEAEFNQLVGEVFAIIDHE